MKKIKVLITAGPTHEYLDPVRYITNPSSGQMGFALANQLSKAGVSVTVVAGPLCHTKTKRSVKIVPVTSALQMFKETKKRFTKSDVFISTAAVSDFRVKKIAQHKLKKGKSKEIKLTLVQNPDILHELGQKKKKQLVIGFALETKNLKKETRKKLKAKNCDLMIGNSPSSFKSKKIKGVWVEKSGVVKNFPAMTKKSLSIKLKNWIIRRGDPVGRPNTSET